MLGQRNGTHLSRLSDTSKGMTTHVIIFKLSSLLQSPVFRLNMLGPTQLGHDPPPEFCTVREGEEESGIVQAAV